MKAIFIALLFGIFAVNAKASDSLSIAFGPSLDNTVGAKKALIVGYEKAWNGPSIELETGGWNEPNGAAAYFGANLGVHVVSADGLSVRVGFGPSLVTQTDDRLSSLFEFNISAKVGVERKGWGGGVCARHWSNAGLVGPNLGFDVACLYVSVPL